MTTEFVDLKDNMTVEEALNKIRKTGLEKETIYYCYVLTSKRSLVGIVDLKRLVMRDKKEKLKDFISEVHDILGSRDILWEEDKKRDLVMVYRKK